MTSSRVYAWVARLCTGHSVPSTAQPIEMYRKWLFPEYATDKALVVFLLEKVTIDVGSGLTHIRPDNLINVLLRAYPTAQFMGVEPRVAWPLGHKQGFSRRNIALIRLIWILKILRQVVTGRKIGWGTPGKNSVIAGLAQNIPLRDTSVDIVLSFFCIPYWISDPELLLKIFQEIERVLVVGGEMRMAPVSLYWQEIMTGATPVGQYIRSRFRCNTVEIPSKSSSLVVLTKCN